MIGTITQLALITTCLSSILISMVTANNAVGSRSVGKLWIAFNLILALWAGPWCFGAFYASSPHASWVAIYLASLCAIGLPPIFLCFSYALLNRPIKSNRYVQTAWIISVLLVALSLASPYSFFAPGVRRIGDALLPKGNILLWVFGIQYSILFSSGVIILLKGIQSLRGRQKNRIAYVILAVAIGSGGGVTTFLTPLGIYPYGVVLIPCYSILITYAIVQHQLMDIHLLSRNATGLTLTGILSVLPFIISAFLAYFLLSLPQFATSRSPGTLACCILNLSLALTLVNGYRFPHARRLFWFFIALGMWNLTELVLDAPPATVSAVGFRWAVVAYRTSYCLACAVVYAWFRFWDGYFYGEKSPEARIQAIFKWTPLLMGLFAGLTPCVLKSLIFDSTGDRPAAEVPGICFWPFAAWFLAMVCIAAYCAASAWWRSAGEEKKRIGFWAGSSFTLAGFAAAAYFLFVKGTVHWYWFSPLEALMCLFLTGALLQRMVPRAEIRAWARKLCSFEIGVLAACGITGGLISLGTWASGVAGGIVGGISLVSLFVLIRRPVQYWTDIGFFTNEYGHVAAYEKLAQELKLSDSLYEALAMVAEAILAPTPEIAVYKSVCAIVTFDDVEARPCFSEIRIRTVQGAVITGAPWKEELQREMVRLVRERGVVVHDDECDLPPVVKAMDRWLFAAAAPLKVEGETVGAIVIGRKERVGSSFHQKDVELLEKLAAQVNRQLSPIVRLNRTNWLVNKVIHDEAGQKLRTLQMKMELEEPLGPSDLERVTSLSKAMGKLRDEANRSLNRGKPSPEELKTVKPEAVLEGLIDALLPLAKKKALDLSLEVARPLPLLLLREPSYMERCVGNLVTNAIKYTEKGSVTVSARRQDEYLIIDVTDTGIGIPKEALTRLFEEGYRVPGKAALIAEGTGVGLSNVRELALAMGGRVTVTSEVGKGSVFSLYLPIPLGASFQPVGETQAA